MVVSNTDSCDNGFGIDEEEEEENAKMEGGLFSEFTHELSHADAAIKVPHIGDKYELGSATVEVADVSSSQNNDSLVLLITYGKTKFLFTGDIEENAQKRIYERFFILLFGCDIVETKEGAEYRPHWFSVYF